MRAVSTVLDVAMFLLLVSAAVGTLVLAEPPADAETSADETADVLASSTLSVEYNLRGETRRAHGTLGVVLARATVANASLDGEDISGTDESFREQVRAETRERLVAPNRTQIVARWRPYRGSPLGGSLTVGPTPPPGRDVHSATLTVPAPVTESREAATAASSDGYDAVADPVAEAVADGLVPDNRVDASAFRESPTAIDTSHRYRVLASGTGTSVTGLLSSGSVGAAHARITAGLRRTFAADMRTRFDTPAAAAETVATGRVRITVRRWGA
jgi:hypothetical protein